MRVRVLLIALVLLVAASAMAATITVRKDGTGDFLVIQHALDVAAAGDTVLIGPGQYLEHSTVRFPSWTRDIESYANVIVNNLTIIGAGADQTFIGPDTYFGGGASSDSPKVVTYIECGDIHVSDLCLRNSLDGMFLHGTLFMDRCALINNYRNIAWETVGSGGWIRGSQFEFLTPPPPYDPIAIDVGFGGVGSNILIEDCQLEHTETIVRGVNGLTFRRCGFANSGVGLQIYYAAHVYLEDCTMTNMGVLGIELTMGTGAVCEVRGSGFSGNQTALGVHQSGGRVIVENSRFEGSTDSILRVQEGAGACSIHNSDLIRGSGSMVICGPYLPAIIHDLRNNYWGTTSEADIQSWIIDRSDDPNIHATVLYSPFAGQSVPSEPTSWGTLKSMFR